MRVALIVKPGYNDTGVGRYAIELARALADQGHQVMVVTPRVPLPRWLINTVRVWPGWNLEEFFQNYAVWAHYPEADLYHITSQNLATLMLFCRPPGRTVITVHDIIPWLVRHDPELQTYRTRMHALFDWLSLRGIAEADQLISDSTYTTVSLHGFFVRKSSRITTILLGLS